MEEGVQTVALRVAVLISLSFATALADPCAPGRSWRSLPFGAAALVIHQCSWEERCFAGSGARINQAKSRAAKVVRSSRVHALSSVAPQRRLAWLRQGATTQTLSAQVSRVPESHLHPMRDQSLPPCLHYSKSWRMILTWSWPHPGGVSASYLKFIDELPIVGKLRKGSYKSSRINCRITPLK
jgi:hypothetical protein